MTLSDVKKLEGAQKIVNVCANVKANEKVLILTDTKTVKVGEWIAMASFRVSDNTVLAIINPRNAHGEEPPPHMVQAIRESDVVILPLKFSMTHAQATREARKHGTRILSLGDYSERMLEEGGIFADFVEVEKIVIKVAEKLTQGKIAEVMAPAGTRLRMDISGRKGSSETGIARLPGSFAGPPNIEANVGIVEGSAEGILVVDGSITDPALGVITDPIEMKIEKGRITEIGGSRQAAILRRIFDRLNDPGMFNIGELGIGLNPVSKITGSMLEDEGAYGTCHFGIGDNTRYGGVVKAKTHIDLVIRESSIILDGRPLQQNGELTKDIEEDEGGI